MTDPYIELRSLLSQPLGTHDNSILSLQEVVLLVSLYLIPHNCNQVLGMKYTDSVTQLICFKERT